MTSETKKTVDLPEGFDYEIKDGKLVLREKANYDEKRNQFVEFYAKEGEDLANLVADKIDELVGSDITENEFGFIIECFKECGEKIIQRFMPYKVEKTCENAAEKISSGILNLEDTCDNDKNKKECFDKKCKNNAENCNCVKENTNPTTINKTYDTPYGKVHVSYSNDAKKVEEYIKKVMKENSKYTWPFFFQFPF